MRGDRRIVMGGLSAALVSGATPAFAAGFVQLNTGFRSTGWLDFDFWDERRVFLQAAINGVAGDVMLDTGVSGVALDASYARSLGLSRDRGLTAHGLAGSAEGAIHDGTLRIGIGSLSISAERTMLVDLSGATRAMGRPINVLLGRALFDEVAVDLDFDARKAAFHSFRHFEPPQGARAIALNGLGGLRTIPISIEGSRPVRALFDLGNGGALDVSERHLRETNILEGRRTSTGLVIGVEGRTVSTTLTLERLGLGAFEVHQTPVTASPVWNNDRRAIDAPANVGIDLISRFRLATDYSRNRLWLRPGAQFDAPFRRDRAGVRMLPTEDGYEVIHVSARGPAEAVGLQEGDRIVALDGQRIGRPQVGRSRPWNEGPVGTAVSVTLSDGSDRRLTLADYY